MRAVTLTLAAANDAPVAQDDVYDAGRAVSFIVPLSHLLSNDSDVDGDAISVVDVTSAAGVMAEITESGDVQITREDALEGRISLTYTVSDGDLSTTASLHLDLQATNSAPMIGTINPLHSDEDASIDLAMDAALITDPEEDALTITVTRTGGIALPEWLSYDADRYALTGQPPQDFNGRIELELSASDGEFETVRSFDLVIDPVNDIPVLTAPLSDRSGTEDQAFSITLQQGIYTDVDADVLSFELTLADGGDLPEWIVFDGEALTVSGTPPADYFGSLQLRLTISDGTAEISDDFALVIQGTPDAPVVATPLDQIAVDDLGEALVSNAAFTASLPAGIFVDPDGDSLSVTATMADGTALPEWLNFNGSSFTGTAPLETFGDFEIELTASDGSESVSETFTLVLERGLEDALVAVSDAFAIDVTEALEIDQSVLTSNDVSRDGLALEITDVGDASNGTVSFEDGAVRYIADFGHSGLDQFTYTVSDGETTAEATVSVTVNNRYDVEEGGDGADGLFGGDGRDLLSGGAGQDALFGGRGMDALYGGAGNDILFGGRGSDIVSGGIGDDQLFGGNGHDTITGGDGDDWLMGAGGNDVISGGAGRDRLFGGSGQDTFRFATGDGTDTIYGFAPNRSTRRGEIAGDRIEIGTEGVDDFATLMTAASQSSGGVLFDFGGGDSLFLAGTRLASLDEDQFTFY